MTRLWISDFRGKPLQFWFNNSNLLEDTELENNENEDEKEPATEVETDPDSSESVVVLPENTFLCEENADQSWLDTYITQQLLTLENDDLNVIILLGFNDCVYSCTWNTLDINKIAKDYCLTLNKLKEQFKDVEFYFCSVNPVDSDYLKMNSKGTFISKEDLNNKIKEFNEIIEKESKVNYIDSFTYFEETGFKTRDGVRYTPETCIDLQEFIENKLKADYSVNTLSGTIKPRTTAPNPDNESYIYWTHTSAGGLNSCIEVIDGFGSVLPNCVGYAWGRFMEILGSIPKLSCNSAGSWYGNTSDGYKRGKEPQEGAVICWDKPGDDGHVAIVERVYVDSDNVQHIVTSESGYIKTKYDPNKDTDYEPPEDRHWWTRDRVNTDGHWGASSAYIFQGFIYNPAVTSTGTTVDVTKKDVISKDRYLYDFEQKINAKYIWNYLGSLPGDQKWTLNAVAGLLGNLEHESTINPGRNEVGGGGFGLVQWTPSSTLTDWCDKRNLKYDDIDSQLERILYEKDNGIQYYQNYYKYTFKEFTSSLDDPYTLGCAFAFDYERSSVVIWGFLPEYDPYVHPADVRANYEAEYGTAAMEAKAEWNRENLIRKPRGNAAKKWYDFLLPYAPGAPRIVESLTLTNLKTTTINPTQASFSFITKLAKKGTYKITSLADSKTEVDKADLPMKDDEKPEEVEEEKINSSEKIITFNSNSKLKPNTEYKILIELEGESEKDKLSDTLYFKTLQDFPDVISDVEIILKEKNLLNLSLTVKTKPINYWGYWGNTASGYIIYLIINSKKIASKELSTLESSFDINLKDYFTKSFTVKPDDCVQIGILAWVKDDKGKRVYKKTAVKTSNVINLLNQSTIAYLNVD